MYAFLISLILVHVTLSHLPFTTLIFSSTLLTYGLMKKGRLPLMKGRIFGRNWSDRNTVILWFVAVIANCVVFGALQSNSEAAKLWGASPRGAAVGPVEGASCLYEARIYLQ
jgi:hypothetical protein